MADFLLGFQRRIAISGSRIHIVSQGVATQCNRFYRGIDAAGPAQILHHARNVIGIGQTVADHENSWTVGDRLGLIDRPAAEKDGGSGSGSWDRQDQQQKRK